MHCQRRELQVRPHIALHSPLYSPYLALSSPYLMEEALQVRPHIALHSPLYGPYLALSSPHKGPT